MNKCCLLLSMWVRVSWFGYGYFFRVDWGGESETLAASTVQFEFKNDVGAIWLFNFRIQ